VRRSYRGVMCGWKTQGRKSIDACGRRETEAMGMGASTVILYRLARSDSRVVKAYPRNLAKFTKSIAAVVKLR
jgi:hypothetical protein